MHPNETVTARENASSIAFLASQDCNFIFHEDLSGAFFCYLINILRSNIFEEFRKQGIEIFLFHSMN